MSNEKTKPEDTPARMGESTCGEPLAIASKRPVEPVRGVITIGEAVRYPDPERKEHASN